MPEDIENTLPAASGSPVTVVSEAKVIIEAMGVTSTEIPSQGPGPHFDLASDARVRLAPASDIDNQGNNNRRIQQQLPLVRRAIDRLSANLNPNAFPEIARDLHDLREALSQDHDNTRWGFVFGLYVMINNSADSARREVEDRLSITVVFSV